MILLSGNDSNLSETAEQGGASGSLRKPYIFGELVGLMENVIQLTRRRRSHTSKSITLPL